MDLNVNVGIGDIKVARSPLTLVARGLGSCVGVTIYDEVNRVGGLAHIMLPCYFQSDDGFMTYSNRMRYATFALPFMLNKMVSMGCERFNMVSKIFGGASMFRRKSRTLDIGKKNIMAVEEFLSENNIEVVSRHVEGEMGRSIFFNLCTGSVKLIMYGKDRQEIEF